MNCHHCNTTIEAGEEREHIGQVLCEDCYLEALPTMKTCDPWAVYSATSLERHSGGAVTLTPVQAEILRILQETGGLEPPVLLQKLEGKLTMPQLEREFAALRHMERVRGERREDKVVIRLWYPTLRWSNSGELGLTLSRQRREKMDPYLPAMPPGSRWADELPHHFWENLENRPPEQAAKATGAALDQRRFILPVFARKYLVDPKHRWVQDISRPEERVDYNTALVLVTHLARAREIPPAGWMISPSEVPGGRALVAGPHALPLKPLTARFGRDPEALMRRARELGGEETEGADVAVRLPGLPQVPMYLLLWVADEEFPAEVAPGVDAHIMHHLDLDGILSLSHLMVQRLTES